MHKTRDGSGTTNNAPQSQGSVTRTAPSPTTPSATELYAKLNIREDFRSAFDHGPKPISSQLYIVMHDTETSADAAGVINSWEASGRLVAAHFVVNKDGSIIQCVPLDRIAHHAGFGDTGHNEYFGTTDESRDDKAGTQPIGSWASDYGMNSYSVGIEMVHVSTHGEAYPEAQLAAVDQLIAYIDAYFAEEGQTTLSKIIDHKAWRSGNSDTSPEFATYLKNLQTTRTHDGRTR
ncbi:N-acetylmuramoyl-L-alanine amidase [uncultured Olegusella sp.]|uniref:N-acetylmuramoyl-L-alanine amidase n=1 Tax=uncultured Olegusella sp. TaxID=1979846 RepID=UPI00263435E8|nr:N-acetylmuramoyl-L-alanine amidase [uncultured Olegusella sp.]